MKKLFLTIGTAFLLLALTATISFGYTFGSEIFSGAYTNGRTDFADSDATGDYQGDYLGTVYDGNDNTATLLDFLNNFAGISVDSLSIFGKTDEGTMFTPILESDGGDGYISGTWQTFNPSFTPPNEPSVIDLIIVKGGTSFSVHLYDPAASQGEWNVGYLDEVGKKGVNLPALSHISAYLATPVPEPATMVLFGLGLLGIAGFGRKTRKK